MGIFLNAFTVLNLSILTLILVFKKDKSVSTFALLLIMATPILNFVVNLIILNGYISSIPWIIYITQMTILGFGPIIYGYIRALKGESFFKKDWLYLLTALGFIIDAVLLFKFLLQDDAYKATFSELLTTSNYPLDINITNMVFMLIQTVYLVRGWMEVREYEKKLKNSLSEINEYKITYLKEFTIIANLLNFITLLMYLTLETMYVEYYILPIVITLLFSFLLYSAFTHNVVFSEAEYDSLLEKIEQTNVVQSKETTQALPVTTFEDLHELFNKIEHYVHKEAAYLNIQLSINDIALQLNEPNYKISKAINTCTPGNFFDFINNIRIEKAKEILSSPTFDGYMEQLAYDVGFNSRAAFYRAFKKFTGMAPKEFLEESVVV